MLNRKHRHHKPAHPAEKIAHPRKPACLPGGRKPVLPSYYEVIPAMFTPRRVKPAPHVSNAAKALPRQGGTPYSAGGAWVSTDGRSVEPGIVANEVRWTSNPVPSLNPVLSPNVIGPVLEGLL